MLRDTDTACVAVLLALCVKMRKEIRRWIKEWYIQRPQYTEKQLMTHSRLSEPNDYNNFSLWLNGQSFDETPCQCLSVTLAPMWPPEMLLKI